MVILFKIIGILILLGIFAGCFKNPTEVFSNSSEKDVIVSGEVTNGYVVDSICVAVFGDNMNDTSWFPLSYNMGTSTYSGKIMIPTQGKKWTLLIFTFDSLGKNTGQGSYNLDNIAAIAHVNTFNAKNAIPIITTNADTTVSINDTINLYGFAKDSFGGIILKCEWYSNEGNVLQLIENTGTVKYKVSNTPSSFKCLFKAIDDDGNSCSTWVNINVLIDAPVAVAGNDTTVERADTILLTGKRSYDKYGSIIRYEWDIGNRGIFTVATSGDTSIITPDSIFSEFRCVLRLTDDDGNQSTDTVTYNVGYFRRVTANMGFTTRWGFTSVVYNNALWVIAGYSGNERNDVWYSTDGATWVAATNSAEFPGRHRHESVVFENKMWVLAGYPNLGDAWYTSNGSQWIAATINGIVGVAEGFSVLNYNGKIWKIAGGRGDECNRVYSSADGVTWTEVTSQAAFEKRGYHASVIFNDKMWVIGGETPVTTINDTVMGGKQNDVWNSTDGINWNLVTSHAAFKPRSYHACVVFRNMIWVIGGENDSGSSSDIWTSHDGFNWTLKTANAGFSPRSFHRAVVMDDKLYIIGGTGSITSSDEVWVLE